MRCRLLGFAQPLHNVPPLGAIFFHQQQTAVTLDLEPQYSQVIHGDTQSSRPGSWTSEKKMLGHRGSAQEESENTENFCIAPFPDGPNAFLWAVRPVLEIEANGAQLVFERTNAHGAGMAKKHKTGRTKAQHRPRKPRPARDWQRVRR